MNDIFSPEAILTLSPPLLLVAGLNAIGWVIDKTPINNRYIPAILPVLGGIIYPFIGNEGNTKYSLVRLILTGLIIGAGSVGVNQLFRQMKGTANDESKNTNPPSGGPTS